MVSTLAPVAVDRCDECPFYKPSENVWGVGDCTCFGSNVLAHDIPSTTCDIEVAALAETDRPAHEAALVDRTHPAQYGWSDRRQFQFIRSDRAVWDVSIQHPYRNFLGRIELTPSGWQVINVDRIPYSDRARFINYTDAADALLKLSRNPIDRANSGRLGQWAGVAAIVLAVLSLAPSAMAAYTPPPSIGGPTSTQGSGTR